MEELTKIQNELSVPKNQHNDFGGFDYRSAEDILNAVKPLLLKYNCELVLTDEVVLIGDRYYIKATARLSLKKKITISDDGATMWDGESTESVAYAREPLSKKGMDESQITGSTSSYARKYALNGLFAIDDARGPDSMNNKPKAQSYQKQEIKSSKPITTPQNTELATVAQREYILKLRGEVKPGLTKQEAIEYITELKNKLNQ